MLLAQLFSSGKCFMLVFRGNSGDPPNRRSQLRPKPTCCGLEMVAKFYFQD